MGQRGSRPRGVRDQRYTWTYLFGAICPARGVGAAWVVPKADTWSTNLQLAEISRQGAHVIVLEGAGWHQTGDRLDIPRNISLFHLPPYSPELNPVENVWQYLRQNRALEPHLPQLQRYRGRLLQGCNDLMADPERHSVHRLP